MIVSQPPTLLDNRGGTLGGATPARFVAYDTEGFTRSRQSSEKTGELTRSHGQFTRIEGSVIVSF